MSALKPLWRAAEAACLSALAPPPASGTPRRVLVFGYAAVGDCVFQLPFFEALRAAWPKTHMTFWANPSPVSRELIPAAGLFDAVETTELEGRRGADRGEANARIRAARYDAAVLSLPTPADYLQAGIAAVGVRAGHCTRLSPPAGRGRPWMLRRALATGEAARRLLLNRKAWVEPGAEHAVSRNLRLLTALGLPIPAASRRPRIPLTPSALESAAASLPDTERPRVAVHLGVPGNAYHKIWPAERFGLLVKELALRGGAEFVLVGGPEESEAEASFREASGLEVASFVGRRGLLETFALIARCRLLIANDTGLAKAAMAMGVPAATVWGPTDETELGPAWEPEKHLDFRTALPCAPCVRLGMAHARAGIDFTDCGHHKCLAELGPRPVAEALRGKYSFLAG